MTQKEQTRDAAHEYANSVAGDWNHVYDAAYAGFMKGVEFEGERDKWMSVNEQKPEGVSILAFTGGLIITLTHIDGEYYHGANKWCSEVTHWQSLPESPKEK